MTAVRPWLVPGALTIPIVLVGCASQPIDISTVDSAVDGRAPDASDASTPREAAAACNDVVLDSPTVTDHPLYDAQAPLPTGGAIDPGHYWLVDVAVYLAPDASAPPLPTRREAHDFAADGTWQYRDLTTRLTLLASPAGTTLQRQVVCPPDLRAKDSTFSGGDGGLLLFDYAPGGVTTVFSLQRQ